MRNLLDAYRFWAGGPSRVRSAAQGDAPPIAIDDVVTVVRALGPTSIPVLDNDIDPEGQPLTLISASAALGTAVAEADGTVTYTPPFGVPPGVVGFDTVVYEIADASDQRDTGQTDITLADPILSVDATAGNTLTVTSDEGDLTLTVTSPVEFAGTHTFDVNNLASGPFALVLPGITGTPNPGATLTASLGLWVYDVLATPMTRSRQWRRGGVDIPGETEMTYVVTLADIGPGVSVVETLSDSFGQRSTESVVLGASFQPSDDPGLIGWWDADDATTILSDGGIVTDWLSKVPGGAPLVASGDRRPLTGVRQLNGRNVLDFDGGDELITEGLGLPSDGNVAFHMVVVIDDTSSAFEAVLALEAVNDFQIDANSSTDFNGRLNATGIGSGTGLTGGPFSGPLILSAIFDRTGEAEAEVFLSDISRGTIAYTTPLDTTVALHVMTNRSRNAWVNGALAELIISNDFENRAAHHSYLAQKWGLA